MRAGPLRHRIDFESQVTAQGATGDPVVTWTAIATDYPADVAPVSGREFVAGAVGPMASQVTAKIKVRRPIFAIDATMRIKHYPNGRGQAADLYNIAAILADPKSGREWLMLPVTQGVNDG